MKDLVSTMSPLIYIIISVVALLAIVAGLVLARSKTQRQLPGDKEKQALPPPAGAPEPLERATLERPVEDTEGLSLRELRQARGAKLSDEFKSSEAARAQKEFRKGAQERDESAPKASSLDTAPLDTAATAPAREAVTRPMETVAPTKASVTEPGATPTTEPPPKAAEEAPATLDSGLEKTRSSGFIGRLSKIFGDRETLTDEMVEQIEEVLFTADIGASTSHFLLEKIQDAIKSGEASVADVWSMLRAETEHILADSQRSLEIDDRKPFVVLVVGVNGVGKTTTIGKLAARYQREGKRVLMIAGDTFRAAAVQQLEEWSDRVGCGFHRGADEADPSGVIFEGIQLAEKEGYDVVLADTAGRLHTRAPLVDELKKIVRVAGKACDGAPHETVLVLDANTGQNAIQQARLFHEAVPLSGLVLTKLDGTAKGGIILGITRELGLPVYYIGIGEGIRDLRVFRPDEFVDALFS